MAVGELSYPSLWFIMSRARTMQMFHNGGILAATVTLLTSALVACDNMVVLLQCAEYTGKNSFGQV